MHTSMHTLLKQSSCICMYCEQLIENPSHSTTHCFHDVTVSHLSLFFVKCTVTFDAYVDGWI